MLFARCLIHSLGPEALSRRQRAAQLPCTVCSWGGPGRGADSGPHGAHGGQDSAVLWAHAHTYMHTLNFFRNHSKIICKHLVPLPINTSVCRFREQRLSLA